MPLFWQRIAFAIIQWLVPWRARRGRLRRIGLQGCYGLTREIVGTGVEDGIAYIDCRFYGTTTLQSAGTFWLELRLISATQGQLGLCLLFKNSWRFNFSNGILLE
jgi:hypothetical protein